MKITVNQLRRIIKEEVQKVVRESAGPSVEELYDALILMCPRDGEITRPASEVVTMLAKDGITISEDELLTMIDSDDFYKHMDYYNYSLPIGTTVDGQISFADPMYD